MYNVYTSSFVPAIRFDTIHVEALRNRFCTAKLHFDTLQPYQVLSRVLTHVYVEVGLNISSGLDARGLQGRPFYHRCLSLMH